MDNNTQNGMNNAIPEVNTNPTSSSIPAGQVSEVINNEPIMSAPIVENTISTPIANEPSMMGSTVSEPIASAPEMEPAVQNNNLENNDIPNMYRPLSPWAYVGYSILFSIPIIGLIILIKSSLDNSNINKRNYARSFIIVFILYAIIIFIFSMLLSLGTTPSVLQ